MGDLPGTPGKMNRNTLVCGKITENQREEVNPELLELLSDRAKILWRTYVSEG
jgi:hypothetical protein